MKTAMLINMDSDLAVLARIKISPNQISATINSLLRSYLDTEPSVEDNREVDEIHAEIESSIQAMQDLSVKITALRMREVELLKKQAEEQRVHDEKASAMYKSLLNAGILRRL